MYTETQKQNSLNSINILSKLSLEYAKVNPYRMLNLVEQVNHCDKTKEIALFLREIITKANTTILQNSNYYRIVKGRKLKKTYRIDNKFPSPILKYSSES